MKKNILFLHTTGNWWDHRYYFKQMPALVNAYFSVSYLVCTSEKIDNPQINTIIVSEKTAKRARISGGFNLLGKVLKSDCNLVQICNLELLPLGIFLAFFTQKKVFYDCREDHYNAMLFSKVWFPKWIRLMLATGVKVLEFLASKSFTGFIVSDPAIFKMHRYMHDKKKVLFYNMAINQQFENERIKSINAQKIYDLVVLGSMSIRTGVLNVIEAMVALKKQGFSLKLKLIGNPRVDQSLWEKIEKLINEEYLHEQIHITGKVPYSEVPKELMDCKIAIIPLLDLPKFRNNMATKQFEYMAAGLPIISSRLQPQQYFIQEGFNGLFYEPDNVTDLAEKIRLLIEKPDFASILGSNGLQKTKEDWNSENQQNKYVDFYLTRIQNKPYIENQFPPIKIS